ncbi:MAG: peptide chain release factor 1 [Ignavibacteria bacterium]|nr:peptide chain release factor 1 [Ignavibacteria bacterium]
MDYLERLRAVAEKFKKIDEMLSDPSIQANPSKLIALSKERSELLEIVEVYNKYSQICKNLEENFEIIRFSEDNELKELAEIEMPELEAKKVALEEEIKIILIPKDPNDNKNIIMEIRAGTGGEEAGLFAGDLFRMYTRFADIKGWSYEIIDMSEAEMGGIKEVVFSLNGNGVYGSLKYENGVHRVQRVPATEASGRIHTSAASVVVMPEAEDVQVDIDPNDLRIDVFRSGGAGGQNVNKVETAIRIIHIPTGLVVQCQDERSQLKNKIKAMKVLKTRLFDMKQQEYDSQISQQRKSVVKSGDRSDKIRTYNFPQNRVTDHRIGLTLYSLSNFIEGHIDEMIEKLKLAERTEKLNQESVS